MGTDAMRILKDRRFSSGILEDKMEAIGAILTLRGSNDLRPGETKLYTVCFRYSHFGSNHLPQGETKLYIVCLRYSSFSSNQFSTRRNEDIQSMLQVFSLIFE